MGGLFSGQCTAVARATGALSAGGRRALLCAGDIPLAGVP